MVGDDAVAPVAGGVVERVGRLALEDGEGWRQLNANHVHEGGDDQVAGEVSRGELVPEAAILVALGHGGLHGGPVDEDARARVAKEAVHHPVLAADVKRLVRVEDAHPADEVAPHDVRVGLHKVEPFLRGRLAQRLFHHGDELPLVEVPRAVAGAVAQLGKVAAIAAQLVQLLVKGKVDVGALDFVGVLIQGVLDLVAVNLLGQIREDGKVGNAAERRLEVDWDLLAGLCGACLEHDEDVVGALEALAGQIAVRRRPWDLRTRGDVDVRGMGKVLVQSHSFGYELLRAEGISPCQSEMLPGDEENQDGGGGDEVDGYPRARGGAYHFL